MECIKRIAWTATSVWLVLIPGLVTAQGNGETLMRLGNQAFRAGSYADARDSYQEALAGGFDSSLLRYNLGVAQYRLGDYAEAELALDRASSDPLLAPLATYNLGLTSLAAGWLDEAERRFQRVIEISRDAALSSLATRALERTRSLAVAEIEDDRPVTSRRLYREPNPPIGDLYFVVAARYGTDDNVYRSPSSAYIDLAQAGQPTVTPIKQSAGFTPVDLLTYYSIAAEEQNTDFIFVYRMNGDFYDSAFSNANELTQRFEIGADVALEGKHVRRLETTFFGTTHSETNFDPDTGVDRDVGGQDVSDRFSYHGAGIESSYEHAMNRWVFGFDTRVERRNYEDAPVVTRYDHELYHVDLWTERQLGDSMDLFFSLQSYRREYDARRARNSSGVLLTSNPNLIYAYAAANIGVERRFGSGFSLIATYQRVQRADNFEGYSDYSHNSLLLGIEYQPNRRMQIDFTMRGRSYDYANAFAFNDPAGGQLDIDSTTAEVDLEYRWTSRISIWAEYLLRDESSSDPRLEYARNRAIIGIKWRH